MSNPCRGALKHCGRRGISSRVQQEDQRRRRRGDNTCLRFRRESPEGNRVLWQFRQSRPLSKQQVLLLRRFCPKMRTLATKIAEICGLRRLQLACAEMQRSVSLPKTELPSPPDARMNRGTSNDTKGRRGKIRIGSSNCGCLLKSAILVSHCQRTLSPRSPCASTCPKRQLCGAQHSR